jgi:hypothetical protein
MKKNDGVINPPMSDFPELHGLAEDVEPEVIYNEANDWGMDDDDDIGDDDDD